MKKTLFLLIFSVFIISCSSTKKATENTAYEANTSIDIERDGTSFEKAIVIQEKNESTGVHAEYAWIKQNYPGYSIRSQALSR